MDDPMDACKESESPEDFPDKPVTSDEAWFHTPSITTSEDFDSWISILSKIEKTSPVEAEQIFLAYDSFLLEFPLCYGYWKKYAGHKARLCSVDKAVEVYERAVQMATYSVDLWVDYCSFGILLFDDPRDVRRLFERGISFVGKDYRCYLLWDKYIEFEYSQKQWSSLAHIYIRTLKYPTKKLASYYDSFKRLATMWEEDRKVQAINATVLQSEATPNVQVTDTTIYNEEEISVIIKGLLDPAIGLHGSKALQKYLFTAEHLYQNANHMDAKICTFESRIRRPYFHVKLLDVIQLENWHQYLDFVEMQGDFDWTVKLYERCLIPCANYPEFWMRYVEFMEKNGGREIADFALVRATQIFLKRIPAAHLFCARFKEKMGDAFSSRAAFHQCHSGLDSNFVEIVRTEANMEKRLGNNEAAFNIYEKAIKVASKKQKALTCSMLYVQFSQFKYLVTGRPDDARDILKKGIQHFPLCKILIEGLLKFEIMNRGPKQMNVVDSIVSNAITPGAHSCQGLSNKDREEISNLYLEFVDNCGTIHDIMKAWNRHTKLFPHLIRPPFYYSARRQDIDMTLHHNASGDGNENEAVKPLQLDPKTSLPENLDIQTDFATIVEPQLECMNSPKDTLQLLASPNVAQHSGQDLTKQSGETNNLVPEVSPYCKSVDAAEEYSEGANRVQMKADHDPGNDIAPPSLDTLSLNSRDGETLNSTLTTSNYSELPQANLRPCESRQHDVDNASGVSSLSSLTSKTFDNFTQVQDKSEYGPHLPNNPSSLQMRPPSQPLVTTSGPSDDTFVGGNSYLVNYSRQPVGKSRNGVHGYPSNHLPQNSPQHQYQSSAMHSTIPRAQSFHWQPQSSPNSPMQPGIQAPNQYQVPASQVQPLSSPLWPALSMQQPDFASVAQSQLSSQPLSYPQAQVYQYQQQYQLQSKVQYAHTHGNQTYPPNMWQSSYPPQQDQNQPLHLQQQHLQHITQLQMQTWNNNYYQQQAAAQHHGSSYYVQQNGQQAVGPQGQGATQQNVDAFDPSMQPYAQQLPQVSEIRTDMPS